MACRAYSADEASQAAFKNLLDELTPDSIGGVHRRLLDVGVANAQALRGLVSQIYEKALLEPQSCELCAELCSMVQDLRPRFDDPARRPGSALEISFRHLLLNQCQEDFECAGQEGARAVSNAQFIAQLHRFGVLTDNILHSCIQRHLEGEPDPQDLECLCKLLSIAGQRLEAPQFKGRAGMSQAQLAELQQRAAANGRGLMDTYVDRIRQLLASGRLDERLRPMLTDVADRRARGWRS